MNFTKFFCGLIIILTIIVTGCSKNILLDEQDSNLLNYNFKIANLKNIDKTLSNQKYSYSTNTDKKYISVITHHSKNATINQYLINKDGKVDLTIDKDSNFIISLPANRTITYTWNIKNSIDKGIIQLDNRSWIDIPIPKSEKGNDGTSYDRQNFYFNPIKEGNEKIVMRYEHETEQRDEYFEITFNIIIVSIKE